MTNGPAKLEIRKIRELSELDDSSGFEKSDTMLVIGVAKYSNFARDFLTCGRASRLAVKGMHAFVLVGQESEVAHDALDWDLESAGVEDAITTWHDEDALEVAEYISVACGGHLPQRIFLVANDCQELGVRLEVAIRSVIGEG